MENRFEHNEPEPQSWKKYLPPVTPPTSQQEVRQDALCAWVCEKLSDLLDNDGSVRPEQAAGIYGHLAVCRHCAQEFDEMQRVVALVENLPPADMPRDFSSLIMQRLENRNAPRLPQSLMSPQAVTPSAVVSQSQETSRPHVTLTTAASVEARTVAHNTQTLTETRSQQTQTHLAQRMTAGSVLSSTLAYFLSTAWARQMLGVNVNAITAWAGQAGDVLRGVPVLTWVVGLIFSAFAQLNAMLNQTYHVMGTAVAAGLTLDVAVCVFAYAYLNACRRNAQLRL